MNYEDILETYSDNLGSELSLSIQDDVEKNKLERIKQLAAPHALM